MIARGLVQHPTGPFARGRETNSSNNSHNEHNKTKTKVEREKITRPEGLSLSSSIFLEETTYMQYVVLDAIYIYRFTPLLQESSFVEAAQCHTGGYRYQPELTRSGAT